jgi:hypothetical protein
LSRDFNHILVKLPWKIERINNVPLIIFGIKVKKWSIKKATSNNAWIEKINMDDNLTRNHVEQFTNLWGHITKVDLEDHMKDDIVWKLMASGQYLAAWA